MSKAQETAAAGLLRGIAYGKEQAKADRRLAAESKLDRVLELVPADAIRPRAADSRPARAEHVLEVAESVAARAMRAAPATPAPPFEVSSRISMRVSWCVVSR